MKRLAVISGGTRGIGLAIVEKFHQNGFAIAVCGRNEESLKKLQVKYSNVYIFQADVSKESDVNAFVEFIISLNLPIHTLINNAGVFIPGNILEEPAENLKIQLDTNLYSAYFLTRGLLGHIKSQNPAHIFNIVSVAGIKAYPRSGAYSVSKFALLGFSKAIREELINTPVKVTAVIPGATSTDSWQGTEIPESRFMSAQDVADMVWAAFNLSPSAVVEELIIRPLKGDL